MDIKKYKNYLTIILTVILFLTILIFNLIIYLNWDGDISNEENSVEVNLPIIEWAKYTDLSKQYNEDIMLVESKPLNNQ